MKQFLKVFSLHLIIMLCYYLFFLYQLKTARNYDPIAFALKIWIAIIVQLFLTVIGSFIYYKNSKDKKIGKKFIQAQIVGFVVAVIILNIFNALTAT